MHSGQCELTQRDRKTPMHMGDMVVCASEEHYSIDMADRHEMLVLELDRSTIGERVPNLDDRLARCMRGSQMSVRMLHTFLLTLWREGATQFDCGLSRDYSEILADLLVACLREEARVAPSAPAALFDRMCDAVERRIDDSSLSPHSLAEELGVSLRTLQGAVAEQGTTPNSYMVRRRMELAARKLTTDRVSNITCVAYDCGFSDSAYFSRRFRDFFGLSPSRYRSLH
jgi:AraC-like DNA-binding protein